MSLAGLRLEHSGQRQGPIFAADLEARRGDGDILRGDGDILRGDSDRLCGDGEALRGDGEALRGGGDALRGDSEKLRGDGDFDAIRGEDEREKGNGGLIDSSRLKPSASFLRKAFILEREGSDNVDDSKRMAT